MPFTHGKDTEIYVTDVGGTERDFSSVSNSVSPSFETDTAESSTFGANWKQYVRGLRDLTISVEGRYDPTFDGYMFDLQNGTAATLVKYFPQGSATGAIYYSGSAILTSYEVSGDLGDTANWSAEFQFAGTAVTRGTA